MGLPAWPERDRAWVARYRNGTTGKNVPPDVLGARERELLAAVVRAGSPAAELLGDPVELATDDVTELATADEAVRTSTGGGMRPALQEVGGALLGLGAVSVALMVVRGGWTADLDVASALVAASVAVVAVGWVVGRVLFSAGRPLATAGVLVPVGTLALLGIASAATLGPGHVAASDVPVPLLGAGLLAPGVLVLVSARRMPQQNLRESWDDEEWLRRFADGLRTRLVPSRTAREHVAEVEQTVRAGTGSAFAEFGHPLSLARRLADADRTARARRWWVSTLAGVGAPLAIAALVLVMNSWGALTVPVALALLLGALLTAVSRWGDRPWSERR